MSEPKYLYKIVPTAPPSPMPETLPSTSLDIKDNFIHLSTSKQTPITARLFFSEHTRLWIIKLDRSKLDGKIEYSTDPAAGVENGCAHLFGSATGLGRKNVVEVVVVERASTGEAWDKAEGWKNL